MIREDSFFDWIYFGLALVIISVLFVGLILFLASLDKSVEDSSANNNCEKVKND